MTPGIHTALLEALEKPDGFHLAIYTVDGWHAEELVLVRIVGDVLQVRPVVSKGATSIFINMNHIVRLYIDWG